MSAQCSSNDVNGVRWTRQVTPKEAMGRTHTHFFVRSEEKRKLVRHRLG